MSQTLGLSADPCRKPKTDNQQLLRNKKKTEMEIWSESQVWNPKKIRVQTWKWKTQKWEAEFRVYFNRSNISKESKHHRYRKSFCSCQRRKNLQNVEFKASKSSPDLGFAINAFWNILNSIYFFCCLSIGFEIENRNYLLLQ